MKLKHFCTGIKMLLEMSNLLLNIRESAQKSCQVNFCIAYAKYVS